MHQTYILLFLFIFLPIAVFATIVFCMPKRYFRFCVDWTIILFMWLYTVAVQVESLPERHTAYAWVIAFLIVFSVILLLRYQLLSMGIGKRSLSKAPEKVRIDLYQPISYVTFAVYGCMAVYLATVLVMNR